MMMLLFKLIFKKLRVVILVTIYSAISYSLFRISISSLLYSEEGKNLATITYTLILITYAINLKLKGQTYAIVHHRFRRLIIPWPCEFKYPRNNTHACEFVITVVWSEVRTIGFPRRTMAQSGSSKRNNSVDKKIVMFMLNVKKTYEKKNKPKRSFVGAAWHKF